MSKITKQQLNPSLVAEIESDPPMATLTTAGTILPLERDFVIGDTTRALALRQLANAVVPAAEGGANVSNSSYYLDRYGVCHVRISVTVGFKTAGTVLFTLPNLYRPQVYTLFSVTLSNMGINTFSPYALIVTTDGKVTLPSDIPVDKDVIIGELVFRTR